jgi:hypothetical protein
MFISKIIYLKTSTERNPSCPRLSTISENNNSISYLDFKKGVEQRLNEQNKQLDHILHKLNDGLLTTEDPTRD